MSSRVQIMTVVATALVLSCGGDAPPPAATVTLGADCSSSVVCESSETCTALVASPEYADGNSVCTQPCSSDADCAPAADGTQPLVCGLAPGGAAACLPRCDASGFDAVVCAGTQSISCLDADETHCAECGCPASEPVCERGIGCRALADEGEACLDDNDCRTANCSAFAGICRAPIGAPCTTDNCDRCLSWSSGSWCSRTCMGPDECNGGLCMGSAFDPGFYFCRQSCERFGDRSCPGECRNPLGSTTQLYCSCTSAACPITTTPRGLGITCNIDSDCMSGDCFASSASRVGWCSVPCTSDAACTGAAVCVATASGGQCTPTCGAGAAGCGRFLRCQSALTVAGSMADVCDPREDDGQACSYDADCRSNNCSGERCVAAGGLPNGSACTANPDCSSGSCQANSCRGSGLVGDVCTIAADCAVGTCCTSGPRVETCATTC